MGIETIAIIGAGELGRRVAHCALRGGYRVILEDVSLPALEQAMRAVQMLFGEGAPPSAKDRASVDRIGVELQTADPAQETNYPCALARLVTARSPEDACREADLIIEAVADELEMKLELFTIFDRFAKSGAVLASTTRLFSITDLAEMTFCPERCIGMRFGAETGARAQVELARGRLTSDETVVRCREVSERMNLRAAVVPDEEALPTRGR
jgi:3-hydroxybutyryl-CoA dehydrogenase